MKFGPVSLKAAEGAILAHSADLGDGRLRKGKILTATDIAALHAAGYRDITVAQPEAGDIMEDAAAARLAQALAGQGLTVSEASTGRANLFASGAGIIRLDAAAIAAVNAVNPMITVATVPPFQRVAAGGMVATVKIIAYAVPDTDLTAAVAPAAGAMALAPPCYRTAALIETRFDAPLSTKGADALRGRLDRLGLSLAPPRQAPHRAADLAAALQASREEVIFVLTASATSDIADVGPLALTMAGGQVTQFGMPVDPGNLVFLGQLGGRPVIGLPGCARSPALNGADFVLERVICGLPPTATDFAQMGVGGLLKEIPSRPKPRAEI